MPIEGSLVDAGLHILTVAVSLILFLVAYRAYTSEQNTKFRFVCAAFGVVIIKELLLAINTLSLQLTILTGIAHLLNLAILLLFFYGVVQ